MTTESRLSRAIEWWGEGLIHLCPASLEKFVKPEREFITIRFLENQAVLKKWSQASDSPLETYEFNVDDELSRSTALNWLNEESAKQTSIIFCFPDNFLLTKPMVFPNAALANLREILSFDMARKTPFSADQVYFDFYVEPQSNSSEKINIELYLVQKKHIEPYLTKLKEWDINLHAIQPEQHINHKNTNFIPPEERLNNQAKSDNIMLMLVIANFILFFGALYAPIINQNQHIELLESEIANSRKAAIELKSLKQEKEQLLHQSQFLISKRINETGSIELIDEITKILPDNTWLTRFVLKSGEIQLQGESSSASSLIQIFDSSSYFDNARFRSPVTQNRLTNKEKFQLSARITSEEEA